MLRTSLRFLRTPAARRAVRPPLSAPPSLSAVSGACRPKSSAAAPADATLAAPRDDPPPTKINVAIDAETDDEFLAMTDGELNRGSRLAQQVRPAEAPSSVDAHSQTINRFPKSSAAAAREAQMVDVAWRRVRRLGHGELLLGRALGPAHGHEGPPQ